MTNIIVNKEDIEKLAVSNDSLSMANEFSVILLDDLLAILNKAPSVEPEAWKYLQKKGTDFYCSELSEAPPESNPVLTKISLKVIPLYTSPPQVAKLEALLSEAVSLISKGIYTDDGIDGVEGQAFIEKVKLIQGVED